MATSKVKLVTPEIVVGNAQYDFQVFKDDQKIGTLHISKGGPKWTPAGSQTQKAKSWRKLKEFFEG